MSNLTPLTSKSGESEWQYSGITLIAVEDNTIPDRACEGCFFELNRHCSSHHINVSCGKDFVKDVIFIEKPAEK